jgi:hypothetical protein
VERILDKRNYGVLEFTDMKVTHFEAQLIDMIDMIKFGSIHDLDILMSDRTEERQVTSHKKKVIDFIRQGNQKLSEVIIHDGEVSYIEVEGIVPFKFTRKIKF